MIDISIEENIGKAVEKISERLAYDSIVNEEISADYLNFNAFEKKLTLNRILITKFEPIAKSVIITLTSLDVAAHAIKEALDAINNPSVFKFDPEKISLDIDGSRADNSKEKLNFLYIKTCLLSLPFNLLKEITVKNIIELYDYNENEFIFKEFFRILACGGKLFIECEDLPFYFDFYNEYKKFRPESINSIGKIIEYERNIKESADNLYNFFSSENIFDYFLKNKKSNCVYSHELLKSYLEYCGFISVFPKVSVGEYIAGKIKMEALKSGLKEFASLPKRVLLKISSNEFEDLLSFSVFIRNLHNAFNNWDLLLVTDNNIDFFENNIYLKYLSNVIPEESVDYVIVPESGNNLPEVDYPLKRIDSGKPDIFFDDNDVASAYEFLRGYGININEHFIILDGDYIKAEEEDVLNLIKEDFPYLNLNDLKILNYSFKNGENGGLSLKMLASIINLSSFYAGGGFMFELADGLYVPSYNKESNKVNYKRRDEYGNYDVSIIIPVFNNLEYTKNCLTAIFKNHPLVNFEIIVINNASTDGTQDYLKIFSHLDNFIVIDNSINLGYAKACNQGAKVSRGEYLYFLNNDTVIFKGAIDELVNTIKKAGGECGAAGSLLLYPDGKIQHAGVVFTGHGGVALPYHTYRGMDIFGCKNLYAKNTLIYKSYNAITAASILLKKELFFSVNLFDEIYKNGFEDVDLCLKLREIKKYITFNPKSMVIHFEEKTEGRRKFKNENQFYLMNKWKFKYIYDDYIFAEECNLKLYINPINLSINYYSISELRKSENNVDLYFDSGNYQQALELCDNVLIYDRLNIKAYRNKLEIERKLMNKNSK